jgi:ArsR family transcriptional regulator
MNAPTCCDLEEFLQAMSSDTRQRILALLQNGEMCVGELVAPLGVAQPTVSHHLAILRRVGLVIPRRVGKQVFYRLNSACATECCDEILARFQSLRA